MTEDRAELAETWAALLASAPELSPWQQLLVDRIVQEVVVGEGTGRPEGIVTWSWAGQPAHRVWVDEARLLPPPEPLYVTRWRCLGGEWVPA